MLTSLAVVKEHVLTVLTGMWVKVQDEDTAIICKGPQIIKTTRDMWTSIETQTTMSTDMRSNEIYK